MKHVLIIVIAGKDVNSNERGYIMKNKDNKVSQVINLNKCIDIIKTHKRIDLKGFDNDNIKKLQHFLLMLGGYKTKLIDNFLILIDE